MISSEVLGGPYLGICRVFLEEIPGGIGLRNDLIVGILVSLIGKSFRSGLERLTLDSSWLNVGTWGPSRPFLWLMRALLNGFGQPHAESLIALRISGVLLL